MKEILLYSIKSNTNVLKTNVFTAGSSRRATQPHDAAKRLNNEFKFRSLSVALFVQQHLRLICCSLTFPTTTGLQDFLLWDLLCVFLSASFSFKCSSPPLAFNSSAFTSTERNANTHQKEPSQFEDFQALLFVLSSFLSFSRCDPYPGRLWFPKVQTHNLTQTHTHTLAVPHSAHLANSGEMNRWGLLPPYHLQTSVLGFLTVTLIQVNTTTTKSQNSA